MTFPATAGSESAKDGLARPAPKSLRKKTGRRPGRPTEQDAIDPEVLEKQGHWFREAADAGIVLNAARRSKLQKKRHALLATRMRHGAADYLRFAHDSRIPFDNNQAAAIASAASMPLPAPPKAPPGSPTPHNQPGHESAGSPGHNRKTYPVTTADRDPATPQSRRAPPPVPAWGRPVPRPRTRRRAAGRRPASFRAR